MTTFSILHKCLIKTHLSCQKVGGVHIIICSKKILLARGSIS